MATTFDALVLGNVALIDLTEENEFAETASVLVGESMGGPGLPLSENIQAFSLGRTGFGGGPSVSFDQDNTSGKHLFSNEGGSAQTFGATAESKVTLPVLGLFPAQNSPLASLGSMRAKAADMQGV